VVKFWKRGWTKCTLLRKLVILAIIRYTVKAKGRSPCFLSIILQCVNLLCPNSVATYAVRLDTSGSYALMWTCSVEISLVWSILHIAGFSRTWRYFRSYHYCRVSLSETGAAIWTEKPIPLRQSSAIINKRNNIAIKSDTNNPDRAWKRFGVAKARRNLKEC